MLNPCKFNGICIAAMPNDCKNNGFCIAVMPNDCKINGICIALMLNPCKFNGICTAVMPNDCKTNGHLCRCVDTCWQNQQYSYSLDDKSVYSILFVHPSCQMIIKPKLF